MVKRVESLAIDPHLVRKYAEATFSLDRMVDQYILLYEEITSEGRKVASPESAVA
jgi:hypothetical protein